jgi:ribonucleoside-diphosphate reductase alpha chain
MAFNSPVWFNVGVEDDPQCSACFINSVEDSMASILTLAKTEGMLFKYGSGTGSNLSNLRSSQENLNGGGTASGPVSFMRGFDSFAGAIKSGGKTRRAAKMVILNVDHPDVVDFIECKSRSRSEGLGADRRRLRRRLQRRRRRLRLGRLPERQPLGPRHGRLHAGRPQGRRVEHPRRHRRPRGPDVPRQGVMHKMAEAAWVCGDPGIQYDTTVNDWHPCINTARINASNPCSEYMFLDDSACNLASLNLRKFQDARGDFDVESFRQGLRDDDHRAWRSSSTTASTRPSIAQNSGTTARSASASPTSARCSCRAACPTTRAPGRAYAGAITAIMCGEAYRQSRRSPPTPPARSSATPRTSSR